MADEIPKLYLDYLEKEMTIMGILSTFCTAVVALVIDKVVSAEKGILVRLWASSSFYVIVASVLMLLGAFSFYRQRSLLAWFYGQICLCMNRDPSDLREWLDDADSWETWISYQWAFTFTGVAFGEYVLALLSDTQVWFQQHSLVCSLSPVGIAIVIMVFRTFILTRYKYEDDPFLTFFRDPFQKQRRT
jgi:hypothetical protein